MGVDRTHILVLNYNGRELLAECLPSIKEAARRSPVPCGLSVIDNNSTDDSLAYLAADIVVSASTDPEAFGRVAAEASAMGRPVVATDHGGARETVLPGMTGLLVAPGSAVELAAAISQLLELDTSSLAAMGARGRSHIAGRYSLERMCADTLALYRKLIDA